jgi:hypothetical protein
MNYIIYLVALFASLFVSRSNDEVDKKDDQNTETYTAFYHS